MAVMALTLLIGWVTTQLAPSAGIEPASSVPKTDALSIKLRGHQARCIVPSQPLVRPDAMTIRTYYIALRNLCENNPHASCLTSHHLIDIT